MLFANPPLNVSTDTGATSFNIDSQMRTPVMFTYGASSRFILGLNASGTKCGIAGSFDGGATWAIQHASYAGLAASVGDVLGCAFGSTIFVAQVFGVGNKTLRVLMFDMASGLYTFTSPDLSGISSYENGLGFAPANGAFYYFSRQSSRPVMNILSLGSWSANITLDTINDGNLNYGDACACQDNSGDIHLYWSQLGTSAIVYSKISGTSHTSPVTVKSSGEIIYDVVCFGGKQYIAWSKGPIPRQQWVIEADSDTNPGAWTDILIDDVNVGVNSTNPLDASLVVDGSTLNLFYSAIKGPATRVQQIWQSQRISGAWSTPTSAFDAATNPPSSQPINSQFLTGVDVCLTAAASYACAMNAVNDTGFTNAYFMSSGGAIGPTFAARYRVRS